MRYIGLLFILLIFIFSCSQKEENNKNSSFTFQTDTSELTNDFYDNAETYNLKNPGKIKIEGEVDEAVTVQFNDLPLRSVIVKETLLKNENDSFVGAYQYWGYSLYDILNHIQIDKANKQEFNPVIDLYVEVEGGDKKTYISWGEIYYPVNRHQVLIATKVTPVVPSKTKDLWPLPEKSRLVVATDLYTHRNIEAPQKISVRSLKADYEVKRELERLYSPGIQLVDLAGEPVGSIHSAASDWKRFVYPATFYGRGRGIHGITSFEGYLLKYVLDDYYPVTSERIQNGLFTIAAADGYRAAFTYSEVMNRTDQSETLLIDYGKDKADGRFRLFHSADFFSDRAIKSVSEIKLE